MGPTRRGNPRLGKYPWHPLDGCGHGFVGGAWASNSNSHDQALDEHRHRRGVGFSRQSHGQFFGAFDLAVGRFERVEIGQPLELENLAEHCVECCGVHGDWHDFDSSSA